MNELLKSSIFPHVQVLIWWWYYFQGEGSAPGIINIQSTFHRSLVIVILGIHCSNISWEQLWLRSSLREEWVSVVRSPLDLSHCVDNLDGNVSVLNALQRTSCSASQHPDWGDMFILIMLTLHLYQNSFFSKKKKWLHSILPNNILSSNPHVTDWKWLASKLYKETLLSL